MMLDVIMEECPQRLKKKLLSDLLEQMRNRETDAIFFLLFKSAIHIIRFCLCDESVWEQIGVQFGRGVEYLSAHAEFYSLEVICKCILETASEVGVCAQAYEIAEILDKQLSAASAGVDYYWVLRQKAELMQKMGDRFDYASIEAELDRICKLALEWEPGKPMLAEKQNIRLWAEYYFFGRPDLRGEEGAGKIGECVEKYRQCCTEEAEGDVGLCVLETMQERKKNGFILNVTNEWALKGMRILEKEYGPQAIEQPDAQALFRVIYTAADMTRDERELYRRFFKLYYGSFYIAGNWRVYPMLKQGCSFGNAGVTVNNEEEEWGRVGLLDIIQQGIVYLSNHGVSNGQNPLKLLLCYHLFGDNNISTLNLQAAMRKALNNQVLLHFVHTILESGHEERQMLDVLLKAVFGNVSLGNGCFGLVEKQQFLNLLKMCGLEMDRTLWRLDYTGDTDKEEFWILDAFSGWQWELVLQADVQMTEALLYTIWRLHDGKMEGQVLELLEKRLRNASWKEHFWFELMQEAQSEGGEWELHMKEIVALHNSETVKQRDFRSHMYEAGWDRYEGSQYEKDLRDGLKAGNYDLVLSMIDEVIDGFKNDSDKKSNSGECLAIAYFYMPAAKDRSMNRFMDGIQKMEKPSFLGGKYFILRAYAYLDDRVGFADYYRENCQEIWKGLRDGGYRYFYPKNELYQMAAYVFSLEEEDISRDFCSQLADLIAESVSWYAYTEGILCNLDWMTKYVSFETVWRRERCIKEINTTDYDEIYQLIEKYLSLEELMDIFIAGVWGPKLSDKPVRPQNTEFAFWESKYYLWLREKFGEAGEERLKVEFEELYALKAEFDKKYRDHYIWQVHKIVNKIKDLPVRFQ